MSDVNIIYKGESIATMDATGEKTLKVKKTIPTDNIKIQYTKPQGGGSEETFTDDENNLHLWITLGEGRLSPYLGLRGSIVVDWGDGSEPETVLSTGGAYNITYANHEYDASGDYEIIVSPENEFNKVYITEDSNGESALFTDGEGGDASKYYLSCISKVSVGKKIYLDSGAFSNCTGLKAVKLVSHNDSSYDIIPQYAFFKCYNLSNINIPSGFNDIQQFAFQYCTALSEITLPDTLETIGDGAFNGCTALQYIEIPDSVIDIGSSFNGCTSLKEAILPSEILLISNFTFNDCASLQYISIPESVVGINTRAFYSCKSLGIVRFNSSTPPVISNANAFSNLPTDCIIQIPDGSFDAYRVATNYPSPNTYVYEEV